MSNFCSCCGCPLTIPIEWECGYCTECIEKRAELEEAIWNDDGGFWVDKE